MNHGRPLIFCIHPTTEDLRFLFRLIKKLRKKYPDQIKYLKLSNDDSTHENCLRLLSEIKDSLLIFLCHGYSDSILGCDLRGVGFDHTERYEYGPFISKANVSVLAGNKILAFCCYSNGIAASAVREGARAAIGFESIRFDYRENIEKGVKFRKIQRSVKFEIRSFLYHSIVYAVENNSSYSELANHMRLLLNKRYRNILCSQQKHKQEIGAILLEIKLGIKLFGDPHISVIS
jgi:hypothetical protein